MALTDTVSAERIHIGFFGMRNAGKSSVVNAVTGQELAVVSDVKGTTVGMWGDSNPIYMQPDKTFEYMNENFVQKLVGCTKRDIDAWQGYGSVVDAVELDAVSGATVSVSNITSVVRSMFDYHAQKYYKK